MKTARKTLSVVAVLVLLALCGPAGAMDGMVSYWRFDEGSGNIAYDSVNEDHGTIYGATWTSGIVAGALRFDGSDWVSVEQTFIFHQPTDAALSFWMKRADDLHRAIFWTRGDDLDINRFHIWSGPNDRLGVDYRDPGGTLHSLFETTTAANQWVHIVVARSGNTYYLYKNGQYVTAGTDTNPYLPTYTGPWFFGRRWPYMYKGLLDEVAIYNRALTGEEIWESYVSVKSVHLLKSLAQQIIDLNLQNGISNSLDAKLDAALQALDDLNENNDVAAINTLQAFINAVEAQRGNKIPEEAADALIATAQEIIDLLAAG